MKWLLSRFTSVRPWMLYVGLALTVLLLVSYIYVQNLRQENKELTFERDNLKTTLTARNLYIDRINTSNIENQKFKDAEYSKIDLIKNDSPVDSDILGPAFFVGLQRTKSK